MPSKPLTATEPVSTRQVRFYKGKGPGRGNSYVARFEEDYSYLRDPTRSTDFFSPLKYIAIDRDRDIYLTLNSEARFRYDYTGYRNLAVAPAATPSRVPGGQAAFTPATGVSNNQLYKQRYALGGDLHLGPNLRLYGELYHGQQTGHAVGPVVPGNQRSKLAAVNAFGEVWDIGDGVKTGLRAGRQQVYLGNNLQVRANVSTNLPSPVFDGFRTYRDWGDARVDAFAFNLVQFQNGILQDDDNPHVNLWGFYGSYDLPKFAAAGEELRSSFDLFYLGWRSGTFGGGRGAGVYNAQALLTGGPVIAATGAGIRRQPGPPPHDRAAQLWRHRQCRLRLAGRLSGRQLCRAAGRRLRDQYRYRLPVSRGAVEAAARGTYQLCLGRRRPHRRHTAHLSADVPEHAVLRAEQPVRTD